MHEHHAQFLDGTNATEIGILMMQDRLQTGRLKVFSTCPDWFSEYRMYHRKEGVLYKENDDLLSATRMATMMQRIAKPVLFNSLSPGRNKPTPVAIGMDIDPWAR